MNICIKQIAKEVDHAEDGSCGTQVIRTALQGPRPSITSILAVIPVANRDLIAVCHGNLDLKKIQDRLANVANDTSSDSGLKRLMALWTVIRMIKQLKGMPYGQFKRPIFLVSPLDS
jgi:hypothetical protein